jgi:hypothetical protein
MWMSGTAGRSLAASGGQVDLRGCWQHTSVAVENQMAAGLSPEDLWQLEAALRACIDGLA